MSKRHRKRNRFRNKYREAQKTRLEHSGLVPKADTRQKHKKSIPKPTRENEVLPGDKKTEQKP